MLARNMILAIWMIPVGTALAGGGVHNVPGEFGNIQAAINAASNGEEIVVANGTWGDFDVVDKNLTIRSSSGDYTMCTVSSLNVAAYVSGTSQVTLRGMTFTTGGSSRGVQADGTTTLSLESCRVTNNGLGGIVAEGAAPTMTDCVVSNSNDIEDGGGVRVLGGSAMLIGCIVTNNFASGLGDVRGGGLYMASPETLTLIGCTFSDNTVSGTASGKGAGLFTTLNTASVIIEECDFLDNTAQNGGGAMFLQRPTTIRNSLLQGNAGQGGGAIFCSEVPVLTMTNCVVDDNSATGNTGGVRMVNGGTTTLTNCSFIRNSANSGGGAIGGPSGNTFVVRNSIFHINTPNAIAGTGTFDVTWSIVQGGWAGVGNSSVNPGMVNANSGNARLAADSPAIDAGRTDDYVGPPVDRDGNPRLVDDPAKLDTGVTQYGLAIDQGAYEYQPEPAVDTCPSDITDDMETDVDDLVEVIVNWGDCP